MHKIIAFLSVVLMGVFTTPPANAQWAVVDVGAITQLVKEVSTMADQLNTAQAHLRQAQQEYQSITGDRGMENLLSGEVRNYLPSDWQSLQAAITQTGSAYPALAASIQASLTNNAILTPQQLASLSPLERARIVSSRQSVATLQATTQQALSTISGRFVTIQQLISAIGGARDQKGVLDLQARIAAEQGMLANDQSKLQSLYQALQANQWAVQLKNREQAIGDIGSLRSLPRMGL
jgi:Skp family chaperone for outer membrane proteins